MNRKPRYKKWMGLLLVMAWFGGYGQYHKTDAKKKAVVQEEVKINSLPVNAIKERPIEETLFNKLKRDEAFWYANVKPQREKKEDRFSFWMKLLQKPGFRTFIWIFISVSFTAVLLWYLAVSNINLFRKTPRRIKEVAENSLPTDIFSLNYPVEIQNAITNSDFNLAIRLYYLQTLKILSERELIQYESDRTDTDYVVQLNDTSYYNDFLKLAQNFEYVWYGQMKVSGPMFEKMQTDYVNFRQRLLH